jgi:hypothetical protein
MGVFIKFCFLWNSLQAKDGDTEHNRGNSHNTEKVDVFMEDENGQERNPNVSQRNDGIKLRKFPALQRHRQQNSIYPVQGVPTEKAWVRNYSECVAKDQDWIVHHIQQSYVRAHLRSAGLQEKLRQGPYHRAGENKEERPHRSGAIFDGCCQDLR